MEAFACVLTKPQVAGVRLPLRGGVLGAVSRELQEGLLQDDGGRL